MKDYHNREWLYDQYWNKKLSLNEIVEKCKCAKGTILYWFNKLNIPTRSKSQSLKNTWEQGKRKHSKGYIIEKNRGENHPNWNKIKENASITVIHRYIRRRKEPKPKICPECNKDIYKIELSFDHSLEKYTRNPEDYKWLCQGCHTRRDINEFGITRGFIKKWY